MATSSPAHAPSPLASPEAAACLQVVALVLVEAHHEGVVAQLQLLQAGGALHGRGIRAKEGGVDVMEGGVLLGSSSGAASAPRAEACPARQAQQAWVPRARPPQQAAAPAAANCRHHHCTAGAAATAAAATTPCTSSTSSTAAAPCLLGSFPSPPSAPHTPSHQAQRHSTNPPPPRPQWLCPRCQSLPCSPPSWRPPGWRRPWG